MDIKEALAHPEYRDLAVQVKSRLIGIIRSYIVAGVISLEDIGV